MYSSFDLDSDYLFLKDNSSKAVLKRLIIRDLYLKGGLSIPELSKGISRTVPTTTGLVNELCTAKIIAEQGIGLSSGGRKPLIYSLLPNAAFVAVVSIFHNQYYVLLYNIVNEVVISEDEYPIVDENDPVFVSQIHTNLQNKLAEHKIPYNKVLAIGISLLGFIDSQKGISLSYYKFGKKPIVNYFQEQFQKPVFIENDSRLLTLGEYRFGSARNARNILLINYNKGIGLGMILNGQIYSGKSGFAGEFGHMQVKPDGQLCYCGKQGCLETVASGNTILQNIEKLLKNGASSQLGSKQTSITLEHIVSAALNGDQVAINSIENAADELGRGLAALVHIFNPEMIVIGGTLAKAGKFVLNPIRHAIDKYTLEMAGSDLKVELSELGNKSISLGVMVMVMERSLK